ncbi:hypothetical protein [Nocardia beijingensis]|uniref:hypothetical protein n=1 Tax=Nocardia beijingensis TaxID=95162 RepID=UPI0033B0FA05
MPTLWSRPADLSGPAQLTPPPRDIRGSLPLLAALAMVLALLAGAGSAVWWLVDGPEEVERPKTLAGWVLEGTRPTSCLRLIIGMDVSGSMNKFAAARDAALAQLQQWATMPHTLRADDEMAVVDFALTAATRFPPMPAASSPLLSAAPTEDGRDTLIAPLLERTREFPSVPGCEVVLLLLSDAIVADLPPDPAAGRKLMRENGIHDVRLLVPGYEINVPDGWDAAFPDSPPIRFDGLDPDETALAIGRTIADLTGQEFEPATITVGVTR